MNGGWDRGGWVRQCMLNLKRIAKRKRNRNMTGKCWPSGWTGKTDGRAMAKINLIGIVLLTANLAQASLMEAWAKRK